MTRSRGSGPVPRRPHKAETASSILAPATTSLRLDPSVPADGSGPTLAPLAVAERALGDCEVAIAAYDRSRNRWDIAAPLLWTTIVKRLSEARQLLHALAELEAVSAHGGHGPGCVFGTWR